MFINLFRILRFLWSSIASPIIKVQGPGILTTASSLKGRDTFEVCWKERESAMKILFGYKVQKEREREREREKRQKLNQEEEEKTKKSEVDSKWTALKKVEDAQAKMDACNHFSIFVRGSSPETYGALRKAPMSLGPAMTIQDTTMTYMRALERLDDTTAYTA